MGEGTNPAKSGGLGALGRGAAANLVGFGVFTLCQFGALSLLGRLAGPDGVGLYGLALGIATPVFLFTNMSLRPAFATDLGGEWPFASYRVIRIASALAGLGISVGVAVFVRADLGFVVLVAIMAVAKFGEALSDLGYGVFQAVEKVGLIGRSLGLRGVVGLVLLAGGAGAGLLIDDAPGDSVLLGLAALGLCAGWWLVWAGHDRTRAHLIVSGELKAQRPAILDPARGTGALLWTVLPLGLAIFLTSLQMMGPRFVVEAVFSLRMLGFFTAVMALTSLGVQAVNMMGQVLVPRMAAALQAGRRVPFVAYVGALAGLGAAGGAAYIVIGQIWGGPVLALLFGPEFAEGEHLFAVLALAGAVRFIAEALRVALVSARRFRTRLVFESFAIAVLIAAVTQLVQGYDIIEIAYALLVAELVSGLVLVLIIAGLVIGATQGTNRSGAVGD